MTDTYAHDPDCNTVHIPDGEPCPPLRTEQQLRSDAVTVAYVHQNEVTYSWHHSMVEAVGYDLMNHGRVLRGGYIAMRCGSDGLVEARNKAIRHFLEDKPADWLFWIDTDMGFEPDTIERLLAAADPIERPIVGGLCFSMREVESDATGGWRTAPTPTIFDWAKIQTESGEQQGFSVRWDYPPDTVVQCAGTGSACVLIHRSVFERLEEIHGKTWYDRVPNTTAGRLISEDLSFCLRAVAAGFPVFVHTGVKTTHMKTAWIGEEDYWRHRALTPAPVGESSPELPAPSTARDWTVPRYAVIPTHNRPQLLTALVASLGKQCDGIVVLDNASEPPVDEEQLQQAAGIPVLVLRDEQQPPHLSRFWNVMLDEVADQAKAAGHEAYDVGVFNDDAILPAGWFDACSSGLREHETAVIAHTSPTTPALLTELHNQPGNRMTPHAFVIRGELGMRADEAMRWWYFDTDLDLRARQSGGVLSVPGPQVVNAKANTTTVGLLAGQAQADHGVFAAKWSR